jgi:hypothetical protein
LTSLVERIETILLVTSVERVVDDSASSTSAHLLEGSKGSTTGTSNESNDTNDDTSDNTSSESSSDNESGRKGTLPVLLDTLTFLLTALDSAAIGLSLSVTSNRDAVVAAKGLVVATAESNTDSDSAEEAVIRTWEILGNATTRSTEVVVATILNVASNMIGSVDAITSAGVTGVIGTADAVTAGFLGSLASTSLVVASGRPAAVSGGAWNGIMDAHAVGTRVNSASIAIIAIHFGGLATKLGIAG